MKKFNIHTWRQNQLIESYNNRLSDQTLDQLFEGLISQDILLNEGISDFLKGLKDKIKNTKTFTSFIALASDFKDSSKAVTFALRLNALGILPKNEAELQILKDKLEGNKTKVNEQDEEYNNKLDSTLPQGDKDTEEIKSFWRDDFAGKTLSKLLIFFTLFQMNVAPIVSTIQDLAPNTLKTVQVKAGVNDINLGGVATALADKGFDNDQIKDIISGMGDIKLKDVYNFGGDVKIFVDKDGNVEVEGTPNDIKDPGELSSETNNINKAADQGLKLNISGEQTANFNLFDYGSSELTGDAITETEIENDKIVEFLLNGQDYAETIIGQSSNTGPNSNDDNSTGEKDKLNINRANKLANSIFNDIQEELKDKGADYTVSGTTINVTETGATYTQQVEVGQNTESLTQIDKTDDTPTQSAIRVGEVETTDPPTNVVLVDFDPVAAPGSTGGGGTFVPPPIETFEGLIREGQLSIIMALIKPEVKLFPYLNVIKHGKESDEVLGGYTQSVWVKLKDNESLPEESRKLAGAVINARKSPDTLTSRIAKCLGIELSKRAKAKQLQPGQAAQAQQLLGFIPIKERIHSLYELLDEAVIDEFIDCNNVNKNAGQLLAYIGSMYASKDNTQIGIVNIDNLPSNIKSQLDKSGFKQTTTGRDKGIYVFLDAGEQSPDVDPNIQVAKDKGAIPSDDIAPQVEKSTKEGKIFSHDEGEQFPVGIQFTQFFKDAIKDGWSFISRGQLPKGTPFKKLPSLNLEDIKKLDYNKLEDKGKIEPTKKRGESAPRINLSQYKRLSYLRENKNYEKI